MTSLKTAGRRFHIPFDVVENGRGQILGTLSETEQAAQPSYVFVRPRHVFRTPSPTALKTGMAIRSPGGTVFLVGDNGPSDNWRGRLWESFRVFEPSGKFLWQRRMKAMDPITKTKMDTGELELMGNIYVAIEPMDRELVDREMRRYIDQARFICGADVQEGDLIDNRAISKVDKQLGLSIGVIA